MGSVANAIKQLREESKYIHILSRAHKILDESGTFRIFVKLKIKICLFSTLVSKKDT
jgi:hypothetical protein